jgi:hypothetical protein
MLVAGQGRSAKRTQGPQQHIDTDRRSTSQQRIRAMAKMKKKSKKKKAEKS